MHTADHNAAQAAAAADTVAQWRVAATSSTSRNMAPLWHAAGCVTIADRAEITSLQLDPEQLNEGVVTTAAATAWYVDVDGQQQVPLLAANAAQITGLVDVTAAAASAGAGGGCVGSSGACGCVASLCDDGWLALWNTQQGAQVRGHAAYDWRVQLAGLQLTFTYAIRMS